jgi:urate oxidase
MAIELGPNQYGKAETRVVRVYRDNGERHEIRDLNVSTLLRGDFGDAHTRGDQARVLPTDSQKNTCFAFAKEKGVGEIEDYALDLARHFAELEAVGAARVEVEEYRWERVCVAGHPHPHTFARASHEVRTTAVTVARFSRGLTANWGHGTWVVSGLKDLVVLKTTGSEFSGFLNDRYTTLAETKDRILATSLTARWRYGWSPGARRRGWPKSFDDAYEQVRQVLLERFATLHSLALQQTLFEMGRAVLEARSDVAEIRLSAPNKHHFLVDLAPFGLDNPGEVFHAGDRPYGLIQCAVQRDDAADAGPAWDSAASFEG